MEITLRNSRGEPLDLSEVSGVGCGYPLHVKNAKLGLVEQHEKCRGVGGGTQFEPSKVQFVGGG